MDQTAERALVETFEEQLVKESNRALGVVGFWLALLGLTAGSLVGVLLLSGAARDLEVPCAFAFFAGGCSTALWQLGKRGLLRGWLRYAIFAGMVSLPTAFFLLTHLLLPAGAATFLTGPISFLYFHLIVMAGFTFDPRLTLVAGLLSGLGYLGCFLLARPALLTFAAPDPVMLQDLTSPAIWAVKAFMLAFFGLVVGALTMIAKRLVLRSLEELRQKDRLRRLFGQYVSEEVRERICQEKKELVGERREVVVLFSDLRGFTTFSEARQPEEVVRRLNAYFDAMVGCITSRGGVVDKFIGDAIMAVFGGLVPLACPARAALEAAQAMRARLAALNADAATRGEEPLENGIGLHLGPVVQGPIGSAERKEFTVIGDAVNTAARLEGLTKEHPQRILATAAVWAALPAGLQALGVPRGRARVKGKTAELEIYGFPDPAG
ncbi:MAG TPA: adenylate/guanylate cyclase domain-containing protein [Myxococcota bacterium]|nr:adenylate/guanylate cyclase domain-containing protein [Myxococcota bacterium]HRY96693.1 adenylate/guanylate cyclase domain-containing protein [Myxococcota bacterium]HSA20219.1 adenylate/guanylate cyclase domain-containing protein [Myxococcota bacterium]